MGSSIRTSWTNETADRNLDNDGPNIAICGGSNLDICVHLRALVKPAEVGDRDEPPHVHVEREDNVAKYWLNPVRIQRSGGFKRNEINTINRLVEENEELLLGKWHDFFTN